MSPTVSPTTAASRTSEPLPPKLPFSTYFFALSHAPPALDIIKAIMTQHINAPPSMPPKAFGPNKQTYNYWSQYAAKEPGSYHFLRAACVAMSTQRAVSGFCYAFQQP